MQGPTAVGWFAPTLITGLQNDNEFILNINSQGIIESTGMAVTQGSNVGSLKNTFQNEWTLVVLNTPTIAETAGVTVSQSGVDKGTLKTTLSGGGVFFQTAMLLLEQQYSYMLILIQLQTMVPLIT